MAHSRKTYALAALVLFLVISLPLTMPARATIGRMEGDYREGLASGWVAQLARHDGLKGDPALSAQLSCHREGDSVAQRVEAADGVSVWLLPRTTSVFVRGDSEIMVLLEGEFVSHGTGQVTVALTGLGALSLWPMTRTAVPVVFSDGLGRARLLLSGHPDYTGPPTYDCTGVAIGVHGPGVLVLHGVRAVVGGNHTYSPAALIWGVDTSAPWVKLTGVLFSSLGAELQGIGYDPVRRLAVFALWVLLLSLAMGALALRNYGVSTVVLLGSLAVAIVEPAPFEVLFFVWIAVGLIRRHLRIAFSTPAWKLAVGLVITLVGFSLLSWLVGNRGMTSLVYVWTTVYLVGVGAAMAAYTSSPERLRRAFAGMLLAGVLSVLGVLAAAILPGSLPAGAVITVEWAVRGLMKDKNVFGPLLVLVLVSMWALRGWWATSRRVVQVMLALLAAAFGVLAIMSLSRATWVSLVLGLALLGMMSGGSGRRLLLWATAGLAVIALAVPLLSPGLAAGLTERLGLMDHDLQGRFPMQLQALRLGLARPLGLGPAFFEESFRFSVHSVYCRLFAENGWVSLAAYLGLLAHAFLPLWRRRWDALSVALLTALGIMAANGFVVDTLHWRFFWVIAGVGLGYGLTCTAYPTAFEKGASPVTDNSLVDGYGQTSASPSCG